MADGWYVKYNVERVDGKRDEVDSDYFILKLNSGNEHELKSLEAYAESCKETLPRLAYDLLVKVNYYRRVNAIRANMHKIADNQKDVPLV